MACCSAASGRRANLHIPRGLRQRDVRRGRVRLQPVQAQSSPARYAETTGLATELNAVDRILISFVRKIARTDFLWLPLAAIARKEILGIAEEKKLSVEEYAEELKKAGVEDMLEKVQDKSLQYPDYYNRNFHGYPDGNMSWKAAFEAKYAWMAVAYKAATRRKDVYGSQSVHEVSDGWGNSASSLVLQFCADTGTPLPKEILDAGCSTGYSSRALRKAFPDANITGIDASPYFVAVAAMEEKMRGAQGSEKVQYRHAVFEDLEQPESSVDMVFFQFMFHELPSAAMEAALQKAVKVVRSGGIVGFVDMNPRSAALSKLPPAIKALRAASEPWLEEYEQNDVEAMFARVGLEGVRKYDMDERHHGYFAVVP